MFVSRFAKFGFALLVARAFPVRLSHSFSRGRCCAPTVARGSTPHGTVRPHETRRWTFREATRDDHDGDDASPFVSSPYSLVTLDSTDTLISLRGEVGELYRSVLSRVLADVDGDDGRHRPLMPDSSSLTASFKSAYRTTYGEAPNFGAGTSLSSEDWWRRVVFRTYDGCGLDLKEDDEVFRTIFETLYADVFVTEEAWVVRPGVREALHALTEWRNAAAAPGGGQRRFVAVLSNFDERLHALLRNVFGDDDDVPWDAVFTSRELGAAKPDPSVFDAVRERFGVSDPAVCLHVGNDLRIDAEGAVRAGWRAAHALRSPDEKRNDEEPPPPPGCVRIDDLSALTGLLSSSPSSF